MSNDGGSLYVPVSNPSFGKAVKVVDAKNYSTRATIQVQLDPEVAVVNPGSGNIWVANYYSGTISIVDTHSNHVIGQIAIPSTNPSGWKATPSGIAFSADGGLAYVLDRNGGNEHGFLYVIDASSKVVEKQIPFSGTPETVRVSADGESLYVYAPDYQSSTYSADQSVQQSTYIVNASTFKIEPGASSKSEIFASNAYLNYLASPGAAISPDGRTVVVPELGAVSGEVSTAVDVYSVGDNGPPRVVRDVVSAPSWIDFSVDGSRFFVRGANGSSLSIVSSDTLRVLRRLSLR